MWSCNWMVCLTEIFSWTASFCVILCAGCALCWEEGLQQRHRPAVCRSAAQPGVRSVWPVFTQSMVCPHSSGVHVCVCSSGRILVNERDQTSVDHIYAIGSVQHGRPTTTGLSVHAGTLLARRLYAGDAILVHSYGIICTYYHMYFNLQRILQKSDKLN